MNTSAQSSSERTVLPFVSADDLHVIKICSENLVRTALLHVLGSSSSGKKLKAKALHLSVAEMEGRLAQRGVDVFNKTQEAVLGLLHDQEFGSVQAKYDRCVEKFSGEENPIFPDIIAALDEEEC